MPPAAERIIASAGARASQVDWAKVSTSLERLARDAMAAGILTPAMVCTDAGPTSTTVLELLAARMLPGAVADPIDGRRNLDFAYTQGTLTMRASVLDDGAVVVHLENMRNLQPVRLQLKLERGTWTGEKTVGTGDAKTSFKVELTRGGGNPRVWIDGDACELEPADPGAYGELVSSSLARAAEQYIGEHAELLTPRQRVAMENVLRLEEGPSCSTFRFLERVRSHAGLSDAEAQSAPLLYAWLTGLGSAFGDKNGGESLRANLKRLIADERLPEEVRQQLSASLDHAFTATYWSTANVGMTAAVLKARRTLVASASGPLSAFEDTLSAWRGALCVLVEKTSAASLPLELRRAWDLALRDMLAQLPSEEPAQAHLANLLERFGAQKDDATACRMAALGLGEVCHIVDHGALPSDSLGDRDGGQMPLLSLSAATVPIHVRRFRGPSGADVPTWRDVAQGGVGNCYQAGAWTGLALTRPSVIGDVVRSYTMIPDSAPSQPRRFTRVDYHVNHDQHGRVRVQTHVDDRLYVARDGVPVYGAARNDVSVERMRTWWPAVEAAYAHVRKRDARYASLSRGRPTDVWREVLDTDKVYSAMWSEPAPAIDNLRSGLRQSFPLCCATHARVSNASKLHGHHVYTIGAIEPVGDDFVVHLLNPHPDAKEVDPTLYGDFWREELMGGGPRRPSGHVAVTIAEFCRDIGEVYWAELEPLVTEESMRRAGLMGGGNNPFV